LHNEGFIHTGLFSNFDERQVYVKLSDQLAL
jgi:hypothetical protein